MQDPEAHPPSPIPNAPIAYYGTGGMPARAIANLKGHAPPAGDVGSWPLDDQLFSQFQSAITIRRKIYAAAQLYRALMFLAVVGAAIVGIVGLVTMAGPSSGRVFSIGMSIATVIVAALAVFYWLLWKFTLRSHRWAPLTFIILCLVSMAMNLFSLVNIALAGRVPAEQIIGAGVSLLLSGAFAVTSWRAFAAIPKYLAHPAWCQEIIAAAKL